MAAETGYWTDKTLGPKCAHKELVEGLWPRGRVHLVAGASDAGKTRWLIPTMMAWQRGELVAGGASHPVPWAYVAGDRVLQEVHDTVESLGFDPKTLPIVPAFGQLARTNMLAIVRAIKKLEPVPQLLVIEGFTGLPERPDGKSVMEFLSSAAAYCTELTDFPDGLTIVGVCESPKMKPAEKYTNPRQRVSGVSAWGFYSSSIVLIESVKDDEEFLTEERTVYICTKNNKRRKLSARFDARGRLVIDP